MTAWRQAIELSIGEDDSARPVFDSPLASGTGEPRRAGADAAGLSERPILLCGKSILGGTSSDGPALR